MNIIKAFKMGHNFLKYSEDDTKEPEVVTAVADVNLEIEAGEFVAILGHNGSGKSTLAKHLNALLLPTSGTVWIDGADTKEEPELWRIRQKAGMVFQNPDNQIIGTVVEEDVGFGPENIGIPTKDIWTRVEDALTKVGMLDRRKSSPNRLSGGQKQRVAIAGIVAMHPQCIILDEPTAMLDPNGRREVLNVIRELNEKENVTVILITHYMEEVVWADRVYVMDDSRVVMEGTPREIFSKVETLKALHLDVPDETELAWHIRRAGYELPHVMTRAEAVDAIVKLAAAEGCAIDEPIFENEVAAESVSVPENASEATSASEQELTTESATASGPDNDAAQALLTLENIGYTYGAGTVYERKALEDINIAIGSGEFIGIIGHTGSGKSTLVQLLNGLIRPTEGRVLWQGRDIFEKDFPLREHRTKVGLVFQYPEHQLFEADILTDVCFGPKNQGLDEETCKARARKALEQVGIPERKYTDSPFDVSGGQKRRVAIAGVLAMEPEVLILDEPTAGLDPLGRDEILDCIKSLQKERGITVVLVTHSMEDVATYADRLIVMDNGRLQYDDTPRRVFTHYRELEAMGLAAPEMTYLMHDLQKAGLPVSLEAMTVKEAADEIVRMFETKGKE
ncbi:MAG: energy-coupling factor transporter ATPase [Lachnospiraceae bacterium]|nr:energy-coupling factor transporter ATPase [Lachnospiraceae bacterium]